MGGNYNAPERFGWLLFLKGSGGDTRALSGELARRVPGDLKTVPVIVPDPVTFQQSVGLLEKLDR